MPSKAKDKKEDKKLPAAVSFHRISHRLSPFKVCLLSYFPQLAHLFDDPEGKINLPDGLVAASWKRPSEYVKEPVSLKVLEFS